MTSSKTHKPSPGKPRSRRSCRIARLWALSRELGIDSDALHVIVEMTTGLDSIRACSLDQVNQAITVLEYQKKTRPKTHRPSAGNVTLLPTYDQRKLARQIMADIARSGDIKNPDCYLDGVCRKRVGKPFHRLTAIELRDVIEALKQIRSRFQS